MTRRVRLFAGVLPLAALSFATIALAHDSSDRHRDDDDRDQSRVQRGFALAPVHLDFRRKNRELVGLGSYIVNAQGGCNDCHTCPPYTPDHDPFTGGDGVPNAENYLAGGTAFGPFISRNLTPDEGGKPAGLTRDEFIEVIRTGHDPQNPGQILQVMPWPVYGNMLRSDLAAVYEYLRAIPHAETSSSPECVPPPNP